MDMVGRLSFGDKASRYGHPWIFPSHPTHHLVLRRTFPIRLQQEKSRIQKKLDQRKADHEALKQRCVQLRAEKDHYAADNEKKQQMIKSLHQELGEVEAELDDEDDDPLLRRIRRECEKRVTDCEERIQQLQSERRRQAMLLDKASKDLKDARGEVEIAQRGAITIFNELKRYELNIQRLQSDVHRANSAVEKSGSEDEESRVTG